MIMAVYFVIILLIGFWSRKRRGIDNYFVANRSVSTIFLTGSLLATVIGGSSTIGMAGLSYSSGMVGAWWLLSGSAGLIILGLFFARKVRKYAVYTLPELIERQYSRNVSIAASILIVIAWTGIVSAQIVAAGKVLAIVGGSVEQWMVLFWLVMVAYAVIGGQHSIIRTDLFQAGILFAGIVAVLWILLTTNAVETLGTLPDYYFEFPINQKFGLNSFFTFLIIIGSTYVVGPDIYSRLFCSEDEKTAQRSVFLTATIIVFFAFAISLTGVFARSLFPDISPEQAFPYIIEQSLPFWAGGVVIAGLIAAFMSSADTCILSQSVILTEDLIKRRWRIDEKQTLFVTRISIILLGFVALLLSLSLKQVISSLLFAYTVFTCGLVVPVIAGFYKSRLRVNSYGALASLVGGGSAGLVGKLPYTHIPYKEHLSLIGFVISIVLLFVVSYITRKSGKDSSDFR